MSMRDFARGYFCAVAALLRETGNVSTDVESLFRQGGEPWKADQCDIELFREHGLMPDSLPTPTDAGHREGGE